MSTAVAQAPAPGTQFAGPLLSGPRKDADNNGPANTGLCELVQYGTIVQNSTNAVDLIFTIPKHSKIIDFIIDRTIAFNSAVSASLTIGTAAGGTQYASGVDVTAAAGRTIGPVAPTKAQMDALNDTGTNTSVHATVTVSGATSAGNVNVAMRYVQTQNYQMS